MAIGPRLFHGALTVTLFYSFIAWLIHARKDFLAVRLKQLEKIRSTAAELKQKQSGIQAPIDWLNQWLSDNPPSKPPQNDTDYAERLAELPDGLVSDDPVFAENVNPPSVRGDPATPMATLLA